MEWEDFTWASAGKNGLCMLALEPHRSSNIWYRDLSLRSLRADFARFGKVITALSTFFSRIKGKARQPEPFIFGS